MTGLVRMVVNTTREQKNTTTSNASFECMHRVSTASSGKGVPLAARTLA